MLQQVISKTTVHQAKRPRRLITLVFQYALSLLLVFAFIFPLLFMVSASFKQSNDAIFSDLQSLRGLLPVRNLPLNNYVAVFQLSPFLRFLFNSIFISTVASLLGVFLNTIAAFALTRLQCKRPHLCPTITI